ncbi:hypothetical protein KO498_07690 [Lentibacter algarum]|uniref:hypothetical protein n=1 Tax=Lentibacter algarum TaxID=576131 RepID=UPI001C06E4D1|nr:hypothetical protein [Lentibacter algarum]MBU2981696.1 hypothetical protein [Lentibacter algarum]
MEQNKSKPKAKGATAREERLKAALKANMGRRKAQTKARAKVQSDVSNGDKT